MSDYTVTLDDDPAVGRMIARVTGLPTKSFATSAALLAALDELDPVAAFIDVNLGVDDCGLDVIPKLRARWPYKPLVVVTADADEAAVGTALAAGANDFVKKPISAAELTARLKARLGEMAVAAGRELMRLGPLTFDRAHKTLASEAGSRSLSPTEALVFETLLAANGMVVSKAELKRRVWGGVKVSDNALDKKLHDVRAAIRDLTDAVRLTSTYGVGVALTHADDEQKKAG